MKRWTENRALASLVLAAAVLLGVVGLGCAKVKSLAAEPRAYYEANMAADFAAREAAAESLLTLAEGRVEDGLVQQARTALEESRGAATPADRYAAGLELKTAVELVYNALSSDEPGSPAQMAWSEFTSRTAILSHAVPEYNEQARAAARRLSGVPASLWAKLTGAQAKEMVA